MKVKHFLTKDESLVIYQDTDLNSYTFDSLLLAYFCDIKKNTNLAVDLCSGNAPVAMLLPRKKLTGAFHITAVEIQEEIYNLGLESIVENKLTDQITFLRDNLIGINKKIGNNKFDLVTCNPPYFKIDENSNLNNSHSVSIARHEVMVNLMQIIEESRSLLSNTGSLVLVYRPERLDELIIELNNAKFKIKRMQLVYPKVGSKCNTILIEAKKGNGNTHMDVLPPLYVYNDDGTYTEEAKNIVFQ